MKYFHVAKGFFVLSMLSLLANSVFAATVLGIGGISKNPVEKVREVLKEGGDLNSVVQSAESLGFEVSIN